MEKLITNCPLGEVTWGAVVCAAVNPVRSSAVHPESVKARKIFIRSFFQWIRLSELHRLRTNALRGGFVSRRDFSRAAPLLTVIDLGAPRPRHASTGIRSLGAF
jgi:hypothetical protein